MKDMFGLFFDVFLCGFRQFEVFVLHMSILSFQLSTLSIFCIFKYTVVIGMHLLHTTNWRLLLLLFHKIIFKQ